MAATAESVTALEGRLRVSETTIEQQKDLLEQASKLAASMRERLELSEAQSVKLAASLDDAKNKFDAAMQELHQKLERGSRHDSKLVSNRDIKCTVFSGKEAYKPWAKKVKAYCNGVVRGFRQALEWAERQNMPIDDDELNSTNWRWVSEANQELYDLLMNLTSEEAQTIVELAPNQGFEAWRTLFRRMDPVGEDYEFEAAESLMSRERCKDIVELPSAIERWQRDLNAYQERTGERMPERWSVPVLFKLIPTKHYTEVKLRWRQDPEKNIVKFMASLMQWANDLKFEQRRQRGQRPMEVDAVAPAKDDNGYTLADWNEYAKEMSDDIDWMGKGKKGRKGGGKGGKGACYWCNEYGHTKADCKKFVAWKNAKDEERKKKGLPPFQPGKGQGPRRKNTDSLDGDDFDELDGGGSECGMLGFDFSCDPLEADTMLCSECDASDWDIIDDAVHLVETDVKELTNWTTQARRRTVEISNSFEALIDDNDYPLDVLDLPETPKRQLFLVQGRYNSPEESPASASSGASLAECFTREREELLQRQAARDSPVKELTEVADVTNVEQPAEEQRAHTPSPPPGLSVKEMETQTDIQLPEKVTVSWIPVADNLAPVLDGANVDDEVQEEPEDIPDNVNTIDNISKDCPPVGSEVNDVIEKSEDGDIAHEIEDVIFGDDEEYICRGCGEESKTSPVCENYDLMTVLIQLLGMMIMIMTVAKAMLYFICIQELANADEDVDQFFEQLFEDESNEDAEVFVECEEEGWQGGEEALTDPLGSEDVDANQQWEVLKANIPGYSEWKKNLDQKKFEASIDVAGQPEDGVTRLKLRKGITMDSGAHHNVMPKRLVRGKIRSSEGSKRGMNYIAANKGKIPNEGETDFQFKTKEGFDQSWEFQVAEVNKALGAVADRVDNGFRVVFDKDAKTGNDASYMLHKPSKRAIKMTRVNNVWIVEAIVDAKNTPETNFARRG